MRLNLKIKFVLLLLCSAAPLFAQHGFKYKAALSQINADGFYTINLQPDLVAQCQNNLADIRLKDQDGNTVPYLLGNALPVKKNNSYHQFTKVVLTPTNDSLGSFIAENKERLSINQLWVKLRNTDVNRKLSLLGSDDLEHWFAIKEGVDLQGSINSKADTFDVLLLLPASNYRYFKVQVNGRNLFPVDILEAGVYLKEQVNSQYVPIPVVSLNTRTKLDSTLINLAFKYAYSINKIHLELSGAEFYKRNLQIYQINGNRREWLQDAQISSAGSGDLYLNTKAQKIQLVIYNGDNQPLKLKVLQVSQAEQFLVAYLKKGHQYQLWFGNIKLKTPVYDLQFFTGDINSKVLPQLNHKAIMPLLNVKSSTKDEQLPAWLLWVAGCIGLIALLMLTLKMTKEVSKKHTQH